MLRLVTGKPGSGKSYYAVKMILDYCKYDPISETWDMNPDVQLIGSLEGCKFNHLNLDTYLNDDNDGLTGKYNPRKLEEFFNVNNFEQLTKGYKKTIILIDEAQRYFPSHARDIPNSVFFALDYHRHYGIDIYMLTQHAGSMHRRILNITETYIEAQPATMRLSDKLFKYKTRDTTTNEVIKQNVVKTDQKVFSAYKSARHDQGIAKQEKPLMMYYVYAAIPMIICLSGLIYFLSHPIVSADETLTKQVDQPQKHKSKDSLPIVKTSITVENDSIDNSDNYHRWTFSGIPQTDFDKLPKTCQIRSKIVSCPPYSLPKYVAAMANNKTCIGKYSNCYVYFKIDNREEERLKRKTEKSKIF